jgi:hypothetical protein
MNNLGVNGAPGAAKVMEAFMKSRLMTVAVLSLATIAPGIASAQSGSAGVQPAVYSIGANQGSELIPVAVRRRQVRRRRHTKRNSAARIGGGAAGGAAIGALAGGGKGAAIGAIAGGGAGAVYDQHERHKGR